MKKITVLLINITICIKIKKILKNKIGKGCEKGNNCSYEVIYFLIKILKSLKKNIHILILMI